jgi:hypothetical protein
MNEALRFRTAVCSGYENLLKECQRALHAWQERRDEMARTGLRGKQSGDELQKLQASYAKAYNQLERHPKTCAVCRFTTELGRNERESPVSISSSKEFSA